MIKKTMPLRIKTKLSQTLNPFTRLELFRNSFLRVDINKPPLTIASTPEQCSCSASQYKKYGSMRVKTVLDEGSMGRRLCTFTNSQASDNPIPTPPITIHKKLVAACCHTN